MSCSEAPPSRRRQTVLVVDDSELMRALLVDIVNSSGQFQVLGEARTGFQAIRLVHELNPDVVTLDLEMPDLRGLEALDYIMRERPRPVVIVSGHSRALADPTLRAIDYGALEFVAKPHGDEAREVDVLRRRLLSALDAAGDARIGALRSGRLVRARNRARRAAVRHARATGVDHARLARAAVAVAASTGGPRALVELIPAVPADLPAAVLVVQHMPATFTGLLAERLDSLSALHVKEAVPGELLQAGHAYIAPGGYHLTLERRGDAFAVALDEGDPIWGVKPAADLLFGAVARHFGPNSIGVVLTGMGRDGAAGLRAIREVGGWTAVQDAESAVVGSMPRAAAPYANLVLPLEGIAAEVHGRALAQARARDE